MSTRAHGKGSHSKRRHGHRSKSSNLSGGSRNKKKPSRTTLAAQELVASFKTMTVTRSKLEQPPQPAGPALPATITLEDDDDNAFTLLDCMSLVLGGEGNGGGGGGGDNFDTRRQRQLNLHDAMNTVSSCQSSSSSKSRRHQHRHHRDRRDDDDRSCRRCRHRRRHERRRRQRPGLPAGDAVRDASAWQKRRPLPPSARRSYFGGFERVTNPISLEEAAPLAISHRTEQARELVQPPGVTCWMFRCAEEPRLSLATPSALPAAMEPQPPASPMSTTATGTTASEPRGRRQCRHHWRRCRHREENLRDRQRHRSRRRRSLRQLDGGNVDELGSGMAEVSLDESVVDISASTLALDWPAVRRHLLDPPMPPSHRVRVPAGASSGEPPPRPQTAAAAATSAAANAALLYGGRLTRSAARTARSVSRQLRRVVCGRDGDEKAELRLAELQRCPTVGLPTASDEPRQLCQSSQQQQQQQQPLEPAAQPEQRPVSLDKLSNANANNDRGGAARGSWSDSSSDEDDYSGLLRLLDNARRRQKKSAAGRPKPRAGITRASSRCLEIFVDARKTSASSSSSSSADSDGSRASLSPPTTPASRPGTTRQCDQLSNRSQSRKIDLICSMVESLQGLSKALEGCAGNIHNSLSVLRQPSENS